jgi:tripartite-type tricarboxylate transporter receptor subunit TctC
MPRLKLLLVVAVLLCAPTFSATADPYPNKLVRIIVPFPAGQATDVIARVIAEHLAKSLGRPFIIENRPGAGGGIGTDAAAKSAPDGYTLLMASPSTFTINPSLYPNLSYEPLRDFAPITNLVRTPQTLVVHPGAKIDSVDELVTRARAGNINFSSGGNGTLSHLTSEMFRSTAGIKLTHITYRGSPDAQIAVMRGDVTMMFDAVPGVAAGIKAGHLKGLAIASRNRSPFLPEVPTMAEQGFVGFESDGWIGIAAPANTPEPVLDLLNTEIRRILTEPAVKERLDLLAFLPIGDTRAEFTSFLKTQIATMAKAVKESGAKID